MPRAWAASRTAATNGPNDTFAAAGTATFGATNCSPDTGC
jgi:hypothetical protein